MTLNGSSTQAGCALQGDLHLLRRGVKTSTRTTRTEIEMEQPGQQIRCARSAATALAAIEEGHLCALGKTKLRLERQETAK